MAAAKHTAEEKRAIDRAWWALVRMAQRSYKADAMLDDAYKIERRERSSQHVARALIVECASNNWNSRAGSLFGLAEGCMMGALVGAEAHRLAETKEWRRFKRLARAAHTAHWAALDRELARIMAA